MKPQGNIWFFYVIVVIFLVTIPMDKFTSIYIPTYFQFVQMPIIERKKITSQQFPKWAIVMDDWKWVKIHLGSDSSCNIVYLYCPNSFTRINKYIVWFTLSVVDNIRVVYNWYWARQIELVTLNTIFNLAIAHTMASCQRFHPLGCGSLVLQCQCTLLDTNWSNKNKAGDPIVRTFGFTQNLSIWSAK